MVVKEVPNYIESFIFWYDDSSKEINIQFYHRLWKYTFTLVYPRVELEQYLVTLGLNENAGSFIENEINQITVRDLVVNNLLQPKELYAFIIHKKYLIRHYEKYKVLG